MADQGATRDGPVTDALKEVRPEGEPGRRRVLTARGLVRLAFVVVAVGLLSWAVAQDREDFLDAVGRLSAVQVLGALAAVATGLVANMLSWRAAMRAAGTDLPLRPAARVFFLSQLGKYLPGSVWPVLAQLELSKEAGGSRARGAVGALVAMAVGVVTSGAVASALLVLPDPAVRSTYGWLLALPPLGLVVLAPPVLRRCLELALRLVRRPGEVPDLGWADMVRSVLWSVLMWALFGLQAWWIAQGLAPTTGPSLATSTGAFALAWVVGFLVVLAPAGLGPREAALTLALQGTMTGADALALALVSRVVMTVADALAAGAAVLVARRRSGPP